MQAAARVNFDAGRNLVPAPQLIERDPEAVGDGYQRIAPPRGIDQGVQRRGRNRGYGHDERLDAGQGLVFAHFIGFGEIGDGDVIGARHGGHGVVGDHAVIAPRGALAFRNARDALLE